MSSTSNIGAENCNGKSLPLQFQYETEASRIIPLLEQRLPKSANIYNMCKMYDNFKKPEEMAFYLMWTEDNSDENITLGDNCWVLGTYCREDYGIRHAISAPLNVVITPEVKDAFTKCPHIKWNDPYMFACIDFEISTMIFEISTKIVGNAVTSMPCKIFSMTTNEAAKLDVTFPDSLSDEFQLKPLEGAKGIEFICNTWKYSIPQKTDQAVNKLISKNKSAGLYDQKNGNIVCGMLINDCGLMGMLHTKPDHRGKGYATLVFKKLMKSFAEENGAVPCSAVEIKNYKSVAFHEKLGMSVSHYADFIKYVPQSW